MRREGERKEERKGEGGREGEKEERRKGGERKGGREEERKGGREEGRKRGRKGGRSCHSCVCTGVCILESHTSEQCDTECQYRPQNSHKKPQK